MRVQQLGAVRARCGCVRGRPYRIGLTTGGGARRPAQRAGAARRAGIGIDDKREACDESCRCAWFACGGLCTRRSLAARGGRIDVPTARIGKRAAGETCRG